MSSNNNSSLLPTSVFTRLIKIHSSRAKQTIYPEQLDCISPINKKYPLYFKMLNEHSGLHHGQSCLSAASTSGTFSVYMNYNSHSLLTENFNSLTIRGHYFNVQEQAVAFLMTIGAKALVLEEQKALHILSLDNNSMISNQDDSATPLTGVDDSAGGWESSDNSSAKHLSLPIPQLDHKGINDEAEMRHQMINDEKIRSIKRKIMSKTLLNVWKRGRNNQIRLIGMTLYHDKRKGTYIMWRSKMNYTKKFEISANTEVSRVVQETPVELLPEMGSWKHSNSSAAMLGTGTFAAAATSSLENERDFVDNNSNISNSSNKDRLNLEVFSPDSSGVNTPAASNRVTRGITVDESTNMQFTSSLVGRGRSATAPYITVAPGPGSDSNQFPGANFVSFLRLRNNARYLDLSFRSSLELEAFLLVLQRHVGLDIQPQLLIDR